MLSRSTALKRWLVEGAIYLLLIVLAFIFVYPIFLMIITAFKSTREIFMNPFGLPQAWSLETFAKVWQRAHFNTYFVNSVTVTLASTLLVLACSSLSAYALSRYQFRLSNFFYIFSGRNYDPHSPGDSPLIPAHADLSLLNSHWSLVLTYAASGMPMSVFLLTGFFKTIPKDLEYSARIDGCSDLQIFYRIMLPLVRPGLATVTIVNFVPWWNDFFFPLLFIQSDRLKTIPLGMTIFFGQFMTDWGMLFAGMVIASVPLLVLYLAMSRQFISGLTAGALKG